MLRRKKGSSYWWFRFRFRGRVYEASTKMTLAREAEAVERAARLRVAQDAGGTLPCEQKEAAPFFERWGAEYVKRYQLAAERTGRRATYQSYKYAVQTLCRFFAGRRLNEIKAADVQAFLDARLQERTHTGGLVAPRTINVELSILRTLFAAAQRSERFAPMGNPAQSVRKLKTELKQRIPSPDELDRYFGHLREISPDAWDICQTMRQQGMRPHEVMGLRVQDVCFVQNLIRVAHAERGGVVVVHGKTAGSRRELYMTSEIRAMLYGRAQEAQFSRDAYLFPSRRKDKAGQPMTNITPAHKSALKASGVTPFVPYDLRHTFATVAIERGVPAAVVSKLLGHTSITMTNRYVHPSSDAKRAAMVLLNGGVDAGAVSVPVSATESEAA
jgi:integrase